MKRRPEQEPYQRDLLQWIEDNQGQVNVHFGKSPEGIRGLQAVQDCYKGECLIRVPAHLTIPLPFTDSAFSAPWLLRHMLFHNTLHPEASGLDSNEVSALQQHDADIASYPFIKSQPGPTEVLSGYNWPEEAIHLLATPQLERLVRIFKQRASRVYATGSRAAERNEGVAGPAAVSSSSSSSSSSSLSAAVAVGTVAQSQCRGASFALTLANAEQWAWSKRHQAQLSKSLDHSCSSLHDMDNSQQGGFQQKELPARQCLSQAGDHALMPSASLQDVEWAASVICTRSFSTAFEGLMAIVPLVDMINHVNHNPTATVESSSDSEGSSSGEDDNQGWREGCQRNTSPNGKYKGAGYVRQAWGNRRGAEKKQQLQQQQQQRRQWGGCKGGMEWPQKHKDGGRNGRLERDKAKLRQEQQQQGEQQRDAGAQTQQQAQTKEEIRENWSQRQRQQHDKQQQGPYEAQQALLERYKRRPWRVMSEVDLSAGDEVTFTYHQGLRDDELLVYYGFLPLIAPSEPQSVPPAPELMAVDHPSFSTVSSDSDDGDLYNEQGNLIIDPLDGIWRKSRSKFRGNARQLQEEMQRLATFLADLDARCAALDKQKYAPGQSHSCKSMPWLPAILQEFRRRRRAGLQHELARLEDQWTKLLKQDATDSVCSGNGLAPLMESLTGMSLQQT